MTKRLFDIFFSFLGLVIFSPLLLIIAVWISLDSPGPFYFRQERVGQFGKLFHIHKFRTMVIDADKHGLQLTVGKDKRITQCGVFLRRYKLDELPQLLDVFIGNMSFVGPRPEVPKYVSCYPHDVRDLVLSVKPGITDIASIEFRDESSLLAQVGDPEKTYKEHILPIKLGYNIQYVNNHNLFLDTWLIIRTLWFIIR